MKLSPISRYHEPVPAPLDGEAITQGGSVIVGSKDDFPAAARGGEFAKRDDGFFAMVDHPASFPGTLQVRLVDGPRPDALERGMSPQARAIGEVDTKGRWQDHGAAAEGDMIS
jgi:hypothetical protein